MIDLNSLEHLGQFMNRFVAVALLISGCLKIARPLSAQLGGFKNAGMIELLKVIGLLEVGAALLLFFPITAPWGILAVSAFLGGAIQFHLPKRSSFFLAGILLILVWAGAVLRFSSFFGLG